MLAKLWKKVLLAVCIIACIFNIMSKLVSRTSLELNLKSVENGESIFSMFKEEEQENITTTDDANSSEEIQSGTQTQVETQTGTEIPAENTETNEVTKQTEQTSPITDFVVIY